MVYHISEYMSAAWAPIYLLQFQGSVYEED